MFTTLSRIRVYDKRQTWEFYFITQNCAYLVRIRGDDITSIPYTLGDVAILFYNNIKLLNDGSTVGKCFPLFRGSLTVPSLSELLRGAALFVRISSAYRLHFSEGARGVHLLLQDTNFNVILHQQTDKRVYAQVDADIAYVLRSAISRNGQIENISFSDS